MRVTALTAGLLLALSGAALADGCGDACDCPRPAPHHSVTSLPVHPVAPVVHHAARVMPRPRTAYYDYAAAGVVRQGGHGAWRVAPNDGEVPMMAPVIGAMPGPCCAQAPLPQPGPCCAPMMYGPPVAYGPPSDYGYYDPAQDPYARIDDRGWTGGVGYNPEGGGGGGGGGDYGQVHFANGGSAQNGPTYNDYNQSFQQNPSVPGGFQSRLMGGLAPAPSSSK